MAGKLEGKIRLEEIPVEQIDILKKNARYMNADTFKILKRNIEADGELTSVPFAIKRKERYEIISGNHRVMAAKDAGVQTIRCLVVDEEEITRDDILRIQLSHNSLTGQDDTTLLQEIYQSISDINIKSLTGLDESMFNVDEFDIQALSPKGLKTSIINLLFLEGEGEDFAETIEYLEGICKKDPVYLAKHNEYQGFLQDMGYLKDKLNIKNHASLILYLIKEKKNSLEEESHGAEKE